jgi:hypothetical protein
VAQVGPWSAVLPLGLKAYLAGKMSAAGWSYARGSELGYRAALYNGAWLHQRELAQFRVYRRQELQRMLEAEAEAEAVTGTGEERAGAVRPRL